MNLLLEKGRTARRPSPQLLMTFDEDAHPRAAAGEHGDKYHGGEFVPKDHAESDHPKPPSFFPEKEREADFSKDADPDAGPKQEKFSWNYPFTQAEAITYTKLIAVTSPDTKFVMDMDPHGDGYGVWDEESSQDYAHGIDTYSILYNEEEARVQRKKFDKQFGTKRWNAYDKAAELDEFAHRRLRKALHSEPELEEEEKADKPGEPLDKAMSATDHPRAGKGAKGKYHGGQFVPKGQGSKAPAGQGAFDFGGDEDDLVEELEEQGEKGHLDASEPDTEAPEAGEVSEPSDDKERLSRPLTHEEAGAAAHLYGQIRNEEEEKGADEREPGAWEAAHRGLQAAEQGPDALHDHLAAAGEDDPHAERVKEHLGVGSESAPEEKPATVTANGKTATITPEICQTVLKDLKQVLKQEEAEDDPKYRSQPVIDAMKQGIAVAEKGPHAIAEFLASANPDDMPAYGMLDSIFPDYNEDHQEHEQQQVKDAKAAEESGIESLMNEPVPEAKAPVEPGQETGPGRRGGRPLKEMGFGGLANFGFKSVAWGSLSKAAKEFHSHGLAASALDLADVTGLPDEAVGLFGHLAVSVGAGTYRAAGAYYDANKRIFNLGRNNGAGAFAHEWAHALDHSLVAGNPKMKGAQSPFATSYPDAMPPGPTKNAVKALLRTLKGSQFVKDAVKISGHRGTRKGYWHNNQELFARAFEGYVQDKLKDEGRENKYLTDAGDTVNEGWRKAGYEPYTQGEERRLINHRFEQLFRAIRSEQKEVIKAMKRKPAEGQGAFDFDAEAHPRAAAGTHEGKYRGGEFVPALLIHQPKHSEPTPLSPEASAAPAKGGKLTYAQQVAATMKHLGTQASEWAAVGVSGTTEVEDDKGKTKAMPVFEFPAGYTDAPTPIQGEGCCHLCGTNIKNYYWIQHDDKKWTMPVGSECVTKFGEGHSGEHLTKEAKRAENRAFLAQALDVRSRLHAKYTSRGYAGYGRHVVSFGQNAIPERIYRALAKLTKDMHATDKYATGHWTTEDPQITRWVNKHGDTVRELLEEASTFLHEPVQKGLLRKAILLLLPLTKAKRSAPPGQLGFSFDEEAHPRLAAGEHDGKYRGGEFVPQHLHLTVTPDRGNVKQEEKLMHSGTPKKPGRSDVHRPAEMVPGDYEFLGMSYPVAEEEGPPHTEWDGNEEWENLGRPIASTLEHARPGQCDHCGARHTYQTILRHTPTGKIASVGHQCYENRFSVPGWENLVADKARRATLAKEREKNLTEGLADLDETERAAYDWAADPGDYGHPIASDLATKLQKFGKLSAKQKSFLVKLHQETMAKKAADEAANLTKEPVPAGKHQVTGVILGFKEAENTYSPYRGATTMKMIVQDDRGFKVYGSRPQALGWSNKGDRVTFSGELEPSRDDPFFGFFKRPTKVETLESVNPEPEMEWGVFKMKPEHGINELVSRHPLEKEAAKRHKELGGDGYGYWSFPKGAE